MMCMSIEFGSRLVGASFRHKGSKHPKVSQVWFGTIPGFERCFPNGGVPETGLQVDRVDQCRGPIRSRKTRAKQEGTDLDRKGTIQAFNFAITMMDAGSSGFNDVPSRQDTCLYGLHTVQFTTMVHAHNTESRRPAK